MLTLPRALQLLALATVAAAATSGCVSSSVPTVAIGFARLSRRDLDDQAIQGVHLAVAQLNREANGRFQFVTREPDSIHGDPVSTAAQLRADPHVVGVVGPLTSQEMLEAIPEYSNPSPDKRPPLVSVTPTATNPALSGASPWVFRLPATDNAMAAAGARFARDSLHASRAMILLVNDTYGNGWSQVFQQTFESMGGRVIARDPAFAGDSSQWDLYIAYAKYLRPDIIVLVVPTMNASMAWWVKRLRAEGVDAPIMAGDGAAVANGTGPYRSFYYVGMLFDRNHPPTNHGQAFTGAFERAFPGRPAWELPAFSYDAALLIGRAALAVGNDRGRVREYLAQLGHQRPPVEGATGMIAFDTLHDRSDSPVHFGRLY